MTEQINNICSKITKTFSENNLDLIYMLNIIEEEIKDIRGSLNDGEKISELVDIAMIVMDYLNRLGLDVEKIMLRKLEYDKRCITKFLNYNRKKNTSKLNVKFERFLRDKEAIIQEVGEVFTIADENKIKEKLRKNV